MCSHITLSAGLFSVVHSPWWFLILLWFIRIYEGWSTTFIAYVPSGLQTMMDVVTA